MKKGKLKKNTLNGMINHALVLVFYVVVELLRSGGAISNSLQGLLVPICAYIVMALSLTLVVGISGELSLGHAGFMSVGAFSGVVVSVSLQQTVTNGPLRLLIAILVGMVLAGLAGLLVGVPVLRLRGDYLAIVTLAFGEIIKNVLNCLYIGVDSQGLHFSMTSEEALGLEGGSAIINGPMGALGIVKISSFLAGCLLILVTLFVIQNLVASRTGRAIMAIRDNRIAAEACGLNITKYKLVAFVVSAAFAGAAGALYAMNYSTIVARKFDFNTSILVLVFVVLGGMSSLRGSMIAAALLTILPEILRPLQEARMLIYAVVLILVMILGNNEKAQAVRARIIAIFRKKEKGGVVRGEE